MKKCHIFLLSIFMLFSLLTGCNQAAEKSGKTDQPSEQQTKQSEQAAFPVTLTDGNGEEITIEKEPERIVSALPSNTEIAFALGLGDKIVGVSDHDNYPEEAAQKEKIGGLELNIEKILSLDPQLVLVDPSNDQKAVEQLKAADIPVLVVNSSESLDDVYKSIELIGKATNTVDEAEKVIEDMQTKIADVEAKVKGIKEADKKKVFMEISPEPEIYTAGNNTFMDTLITIIHAENASKEIDGWQKVNDEAVIKMNPDVIITTYSNYVDNPVEQVLKREGWTDITAIKEKQVVDVHSDLINRPGPRLAEGVEELAKAVYPDAFQ